MNVFTKVSVEATSDEDEVNWEKAVRLLKKRFSTKYLVQTDGNSMVSVEWLVRRGGVTAATRMRVERVVQQVVASCRKNQTMQ